VTHETFVSAAGLALAMTFAGFAAGLVYFIALHRTVALFSAGGSRLGPSALTLGRIVAITILLALAARLGAAPLIATFLGFLVARAVALHATRRDK
jgi:N-ATPase, AtpR subunit